MQTKSSKLDRPVLQKYPTDMQPVNSCLVVLPLSIIGTQNCVPSFLEAALGQVASEGWEPSLQAVLMGAALTARKCFLCISMFFLVDENLCPTIPVCAVPYAAYSMQHASICM